LCSAGTGTWGSSTTLLLIGRPTFRGLSSLLQENRQREVAVLDHRFSDGHFFHFLVAGDVIHQIEHQFLDDHPQAACAYLSHKRLACDGTSRLVAEGDFNALEVEELGILLQDCVSGLGKDFDQGCFIKLVKDSHDWEPAVEFGNKTI